MKPSSDKPARGAANDAAVAEAVLDSMEGARRKCIEECLQRNQARAVGADVIQHDCEAECMEKHPLTHADMEPHPEEEGRDQEPQAH